MYTNKLLSEECQALIASYSPSIILHSSRIPPRGRQVDLRFRPPYTNESTSLIALPMAHTGGLGLSCTLDNPTSLITLSIAQSIGCEYRQFASAASTWSFIGPCKTISLILTPGPPMHCQIGSEDRLRVSVVSIGEHWAKPTPCHSAHPRAAMSPSKD